MTQAWQAQRESEVFALEADLLEQAGFKREYLGLTLRLSGASLSSHPQARSA